MGRFVPDKDIKIRVERIATGVTVGTVSGRRRRQRKTMQTIADEIVLEAKLLTSLPAEKPRRMRGGLPRYGRNKDFRRSHRGPTYRSSFRTQVIREGGRYAVRVINAHDSADRVEFGTAGGPRGGIGKETPQRNPTSRFHKLPISQRLYKEIRAKSKARWSTPQMKKYKATIERGRYAQRMAAKIVANRSSMSTAAFEARAERYKDQIHDASATRLRLEYEGRNEAMVRSFDPATGGPSLLVLERKTYTRYAIMQRAMRNVVRRNFE